MDNGRPVFVFVHFISTPFKNLFFKYTKIVSEKRDETPYHLLKGEWPKFANDFEERENASSLRQQQQ